MIGLIIALWYEIVFILIWIIYSISYPILLLSLLVPLLLYPKATIYKYYFIYTSFQYILFCQDKKKDKKKKKKTDTVDTTTGSTSSNGSENSDPSIYFPGYSSHPSTTTDATTNTSSDDTTTSSSSSSSLSSSSSHITKKTILFIRHGESTWNYTFNKGNERSTFTFVLYFIPNLISTILHEYYYYMTGQGMESLLYDSPLSDNGIQQAMTIQQFIQSSNLQFVTPKEEKFITLLKGTTSSNTATIPNDTVYMVSNLRRAITTAGIAFYTQLTTPLPPTTTTTPTTQNDKPSSSSLPSPKLMIVSALQEISTNPDALCISPSSSPSSSSLSKSRMVDSTSDPIHIRRYIYGNSTSITNTGSSSSSSSSSGGGVLDTTYHTGNKSITSTGRQRIHEFCHLLFHNTTTSITGTTSTTASPLTDTTTTTTTTMNTPNDVSNANNYIVTGHSLWFLTFFQLLLPTSCNHIAKKKKLQNGSIIGFTLLHTTTTTTTSGNSNSSGDTNDTKVTDHYMIDPISLVVVHGGF